MKIYDFITLGSATVDVFVYTKDSEVIKIIHPKLETDLIAYPLGSKIIIDSIEYHIGGGGTNSAVALAKLGLRVGFNGNIGKDQNGKMVLELLNKYNIDFIGKIQGKTGFSVILDSFANDRTILTFKGTNDNSIELKHYSRAIYSSALTGKAFNTQSAIFKKAKENNAIVFFNPSSYVVSKGIKSLYNILKNVDYLIFNLEEAMSLTNEQEIVRIYRKLYRIFNFKSVLITNGSDGVYFNVKNKIYKIDAHKVKVRETTGAGDAFGSTFAGMMLLSNDIFYSVKMGMINAESVIQYPGAKNGLLGSKELKRLYRKSKYNMIVYDIF